MKTIAVIGFILAIILTLSGLVVSLNEPAPTIFLTGAGAGFLLVLLSTIVLGVRQVRDSQRQAVEIILHVNGLEYRKVWLGTRESLRLSPIEPPRLSPIEPPSVGA